MEAPILLLSVVIVVVAITTHEAAHAWVADRLGDPTARQLGRVTLNPLPHIDLFMTILLPGALLLAQTGIIFGGAKPVPVIPWRFKRPFRDMALVAAAGPLSNLLQALLWGVVLKIFLTSGIWSSSSQGIVVFQLGIFVNVLLFVFNLIPIPPLDGSRILAFFLKGQFRQQYMSLERYGIFIILACIWFIPTFQTTLVRVIFFFGNLVGDLTGLSSSAVSWAPPYLFQS